MPKSDSKYPAQSQSGVLILVAQPPGNIEEYERVSGVVPCIWGVWARNIKHLLHLVGQFCTTI